MPVWQICIRNLPGLRLVQLALGNQPADDLVVVFRLLQSIDDVGLTLRRQTTPCFRKTLGVG